MRIHGFKSFAEDTTINFDKGITVIIGPNGSGKSNISDAISWVLGEQNAHELRGSRMQDLIFSGTEKRRQLSYCEVTLLFDNTDNKMPIAYTEVEICRRVYRSGESRYFINKIPKRLKDISMLLLDTGLGADGYCVIGQGRVDDILNAKLQERRAVFEEAAGIGRYKTRKAEAERSLKDTADNLARLDDILLEIEGRLEPLLNQRDKALTLFALQEQARVLDANIFLHHYERQLQQYNNAQQGMQQHNTVYAQLQTALDALLQETTALEQQREQLLLQQNSLQEELLQHTAQAEQLMGKKNLLTQQLAHAQQTLEQHKAAQNTDASGNAQIEAQIVADAEEITQLTAQLNAAQAELQQKKQQDVVLSEQIAQQDLAVDAAKNAIIAHINSIGDVQARASRLSAMEQSLLQRQEQLQSEHARSAAQRKDLQTEREQVTAQIAGFSAQIKDLQTEAAALAQQQQQAQAAVQRARRDEQSAQANLQALTARQRMLQDLQRDYEGYQNSVKNLLSDTKRNADLSARVHGVVANLIAVPEQYERAIEQALGATLQNIVTNTQEDARVLIEYLRQKQYGRATFLPLDAITGRSLSAAEQKSLAMPGCIGQASALVQFDEQYRNIIENLLGRTVIVEDMQTGIAMARANRQAFRIVSLQGDIINVGGSMQGGSTSTSTSSLLARARNVQAFAARITQAQAALQQATQALTQCLQAEEECTAADRKSVV